MMLTRRIFWKLFLSFWTALLLFAFGVLFAASAYLDSTREHYHNSPPRERSSAVFAAAQQDFAVMAGNGRFGNLEAVVLDPADRGFVHFQLVRSTGQCCGEDD